MDKKDIIRLLSSRELSDKQMLEELRSELDAELTKPEPDYSRVAELTEAMRTIAGDDPQRDSENIAVLTEEVRARSRRFAFRRYTRWAMTLAACFVVGLCIRSYETVADPSTLADRWIVQNGSGFVIDISQEDFSDADPFPTVTTSSSDPEEPVTTTTTTAPQGEITTTALAQTVPTVTVTTTVYHPDYGYGTYVSDKMLELAEPYGVYPDVVAADRRYKYFIDTELTDFQCEELTDSTNLYYTFESGECTLYITAELYKTPVPNQIIPFDEDTEYETFDDPPAYVFTEDSTGTVVFHQKGSSDLYTVTVIYKNGSHPYPELMYYNFARAFTSAEKYMSGRPQSAATEG